MGQPVRILHVLGGTGLGGAESRIMDLYRNMDRDRVQFDFLVHSDQGAQRKPQFYDGEIEHRGGRIYVLPRFKGYNYPAYRRAAGEFFAAHHEFTLVQGHMTSTASIYLPEAKKAGVPTVAAHARSAGVDPGLKGVLTGWLRRSLLRKADYCLACSLEAGEAVFGKNWRHSGKDFVIPNAIEAEKYGYNEKKRKETRQALGLTDCLVLGHVGRFHYAKNHEYLLKVFEEVHRRLSQKGRRAVLLLLGEGSGMEAARSQAGEAHMTQDVLFMGNRADVESYYQAMDFFVFPSRFEGLPGTVIEAQAAGLRCVISDRITQEAALCDLVHRESIDEPADRWADYILSHADYERKDTVNILRQAGFDVKEQAARLTQFYETGRLSRLSEDGRQK